MDNNFKYYALPPEGLATLREYGDGIDALRAEMDGLQQEYQRKVDEAQIKAREVLKPLWYEMAAMAGIDAEITWGDHEWSVERRFLNDGFGAITYVAQPMNPFTSMVAPDEDEEGVPPGVTVN